MLTRGGSTLLTVAGYLLVVFGVLVVVAVVALVLLRLILGWREARHDRRSSEVRAIFFDLLMGDEESSAAARLQLDSMRGRQWDFTEDRAFEMLPKLRGAIRDDLVTVLRERGALTHAESLTTSWSSVRRCRGAFGLGAIGGPEHVPTLVALLKDKSFLVRRVAVRALGNIRSADAVPALLHDVPDPVRLSRDVLYALDRIGSAGAPALRRELAAAVDLGDPTPSAEHAATALGLIEDVRSVPLLCRAIRLDDDSISLAAAEALGRIGSPDAISTLTESLFHDRDPVRIAATKALGSLGSPLAIDSLLLLVEQDDPLTSRDAAEALRKLGPGGTRALDGSTSPYAREALALGQLARP